MLPPSSGSEVTPNRKPVWSKQRSVYFLLHADFFLYSVNMIIHCFIIGEFVTEWSVVCIFTSLLCSSYWDRHLAIQNKGIIFQEMCDYAFHHYVLLVYNSKHLNCVNIFSAMLPVQVQRMIHIANHSQSHGLVHDHTLQWTLDRSHTSQASEARRNQLMRGDACLHPSSFPHRHHILPTLLLPHRQKQAGRYIHCTTISVAKPHSC